MRTPPNAAVLLALALALAAAGGPALEAPRVRRTAGPLAADARFDVVVSLPLDPLASGLFRPVSRAGFETARAHLLPDGVLVALVPGRGANPFTAPLVARALHDVLPQVTGWGGPTQLVLVASARAPTPDFARIAARLEAPEVATALARIGVVGVVGLLSRQTHTEEGVTRLAARTQPLAGARERYLARAAIADFVDGAQPLEDERVQPRVWRRLLLAGWLEAHPLTAAEAKAAYLGLRPALPEASPLARSAADAWLAHAPDDGDAALAVAAHARAQRDIGAALAALDRQVLAGTRRADVLARWLELKESDARRTHAPWHPVHLDEARALVRSRTGDAAP